MWQDVSHVAHMTRLQPRKPITADLLLQPITCFVIDGAQHTYNVKSGQKSVIGNGNGLAPHDFEQCWQLGLREPMPPIVYSS